MKAIILLLSLTSHDAGHVRIEPRDNYARVRVGQYSYAAWIDAGVWTRVETPTHWQYHYYPTTEAATLARRLPSAEACAQAIELNRAELESIIARRDCDFAHRFWKYEAKIRECERAGETWRALQKLRQAMGGASAFNLSDDVAHLRASVGPRFAMPRPVVGIDP